MHSLFYQLPVLAYRELRSRCIWLRQRLKNGTNVLYNIWGKENKVIRALRMNRGSGREAWLII